MNFSAGSQGTRSSRGLRRPLLGMRRTLRGMSEMSEFISELEKIIPAEELLFEPTPGFGPYKPYFPEDAVQHPAKANTLLIEFLINEFTREGDTVLDPMAGTGSTGVIAALHGRNAILVDIEEKFVKWMEEAKIIVDRVQTLTRKGKIVVLRGDARQLSKILDGADYIVTSPPYEKSNCVKEKSEQFWKKAREMGKRWGSKPPSGTEEKQYSDDNIGNLPHGNVDTIITSPPYSESLTDRRKGYTKIPQLEHTRQYHTQNMENIGNLLHGSVDIILTSPPYADAKKGGEVDEEKMAERWDKAAEDKDWNTWSKTWKTKGRKRALKALGSGYSDSEENIGNLPWSIDAIITSPPYLKSAESGAGINRQREGDVKIGCATEGREVSNPEAVDNTKCYGEIDVVLTSPPYSEGIGHDSGDNASEEYKERLEMQRRYTRQMVSEGNIAKLKHGFVDAILTSPPYEASLEGTSRHTKGGIVSRDKKLAQTGTYYILTEDTKKGVPISYSSSPENIGNLKSSNEDYESLEKLKDEKIEELRERLMRKGKPTYLSEMLKVYHEMFKVLKEGGRAIIIVKPFIRNKQVVDLPYHTWLLMQKVGFRLEKLFKLRLKQQSFWRVLYERRYPTVPKIRHEYVIVARK
ncbi:MAG: DNA methyltransferase [Methermicoccaceae archaeon]